MTGPPTRRLGGLTVHLCPPHIASAAGAAPFLTAAALQPVPILATPTQGHVHPSVCQTADGTLVVVYGDDIDPDTDGKDVLMCCTSKEAGDSGQGPQYFSLSLRALRAAPTCIYVGGCVCCGGVRGWGADHQKSIYSLTAPTLGRRGQLVSANAGAG